TQHHLRRLRINVVKVDVVVAREIEIPVDTQHTSPRAEVLLLLLVAEHQKGSIDDDVGADPAVRGFHGAYVVEHSDGACQAVDLVVGDAGQLHDKSRGTCSLIPGQHFALAKLNLAREECDSEDCRC